MIKRNEIYDNSSRIKVINFVFHLIQGRWFSLFSSILIMAGAGTTYLFGIYSQEIKASLGYDQSTLNLLGFFKDLGANVGVISGLMAEIAPNWLLLLIGSTMNFGGFLMIWLAVTGKIAHPKIWQMCIYICIGANSQNFQNTVVLVTSVRNFPENRGAVLGLLKGFAGLSGAILAQIYLAIYGNDPKSLILLTAWLPAIVSMFFVYMIREIKGTRHPNELRVFYHYLYLAIALALLIMTLTIAQKLLIFSQTAYVVSAMMVCGLLFSPIMVAIKEELITWNLKKKPIIQKPPGKIEPKPKLISTVRLSERQNISWFSSIVNKPARGEDYTILQAILSIDMLILFIATMCGMGSSLTAIDNMGQIGESLGYPRKTVSSFVSLLSIWNFFGRIFAGFVSEYLLAKYKFPRPLMTTMVLFLSCVGHLLIAFPFPGSVYIASVIIGFSFGAQFPLMNAIISELFGLKHYSTLFNCGQLASPLGSFILNVKVSGLLYDREALKELAIKGIKRSSGKELTCIGSHCYRISFVILACVTCFGAVASMVLVQRTKHFYRGDIYKKFRSEAEATE